jgi:putative GTP pyrophosphokinase
MTTYADQLAAEYKEKRQGYEDFTHSVRRVLEQLIKDASIDLVAIEYRTKNLESFKEKVDRPEKAQKYQSCKDITDLSGVRVVAFMREEHDKICQIIEKNFVVDPKNSANKEDLLAPDEFGYRSTHFVVSYNGDRLKLPEFTRFAEMKAEVQVRTLLQHAWAAIDWKLRYKTDIGVPNNIRRRLYRISALLESADDDFSRVSRLVQELREDYKKQLEVGDLKMEVNQESLELFLKSSKVVQQLKSIAVDVGYVIAPPHPRSLNPLLNLSLTLNTAGIDEISELEKRLEAALPRAKEFLGNIYAAWFTPGRPKRLGIDLGGLIRLLVTDTSDKLVAHAILQKTPFGPELNKAVQKVVDEKLAA